METVYRSVAAAAKKDLSAQEERVAKRTLERAKIKVGVGRAGDGAAGAGIRVLGSRKQGRLESPGS